MILNFHGGTKIDAKRRFAQSEIKYINSCSAICIKAGEDFMIETEIGSNVSKGSLLGFSDGTPVYSSISGVFNGVLEIEDDEYFVVMENGEDSEAKISEPETRALTELTKEDVITAARQYAVTDPRSGRPLWELLSQLKSCKRVVIDCTEPFAHSAINYRLCIEKAKELVYGAKILLQASGALKCVFAVEQSKKDLKNNLSEYANDDKLFAIGLMEEKYPYGDAALMYGIYVQELKPNQTAMDKKVLIVSAETAIALYESMVSGMPHIYRYITICGDDVNGGNFKVPRGITMHDLTEICGGFPEDKLIIENTLLSGNPIKGVINDGTLALIVSSKEEKKRSDCISCGKCTLACPSKLFPNEILLGANPRMAKRCIGCGACEYVCPGGIPLVSMIKSQEENENDQ